MSQKRNIPKRPTGDDPFHIWAQAVHDRVFKLLNFNNSPTVTWKEDQNGYTAFAAPGGPSGTTIVVCVVTKLYGEGYDYIGVTPFSLQTNAISGAQFNLAKCLTARQVTAETIDGNIVTYTYQDDNTRIANYPAYGNERQVVHPRYLIYSNANPDTQPLEQSLIFASAVVGGTDVSDGTGVLQSTELQPYRYWARSNNQNSL